VQLQVIFPYFAFIRRRANCVGGINAPGEGGLLDAIEKPRHGFSLRR